MKRKYDWENEESIKLRDKAKSMGKVYILVTIKNNTFMDGNEVVRTLQWDGVSSSNGWHVVHTEKKANGSYDFYAHISIEEADVSDEGKDESEQKLEKKILVKEATEDEEAEYKEVSAEVTHVKMKKSADVRATLIVKDKSGKKVFGDSYSTSHHFADNYCHYDGDSEALDGLDCDSFSLGHDFPDDDDMLEECAKKLNSKICSGLSEVDVKQ